MELGARGRRPEVFLDSQRLEHGTSLSLELVRAVRSTRVMVPIVSVGALDELARTTESEDSISYLLLEWWAAVELHSADILARVLPIVLGFTVSSDDGSSRLMSLLDERSRWLRRLPKKVSLGTHRELVAAFAELGLEESPKERTVREVVSAVFDYVAVCTVALGATTDVIPPAFHARESSSQQQSSSAGRNLRHSLGPVSIAEAEVWNVEMQCSIELVRVCEAVLAVENHSKELDASSPVPTSGNDTSDTDHTLDPAAATAASAIYDDAQSLDGRKVTKKLTKALAKVEERLLDAVSIVIEDVREYAVLWAEILKAEHSDIVELERE